MATAKDTLKNKRIENALRIRNDIDKLDWFYDICCCAKTASYETGSAKENRIGLRKATTAGAIKGIIRLRFEPKRRCDSMIHAAFGAT